MHQLIPPIQEIVWGLRYLTCARPNILYEVGLISIFIKVPRQPLVAVKCILLYIEGTHNHGLFYQMIVICLNILIVMGRRPFYCSSIIFS